MDSLAIILLASLDQLLILYPASTEWIELLRSACETLNQAPTQLIVAISVVGVTNGTLMETLVLERLSTLFAQEYGFGKQVTLGEHTFTIRFERRNT